MKTVKCSSFRSLVVAMLFAAGIATTIATGGGGSGGSVTPPPPPPPSSQAIAITAVNAHDVSSALFFALGMSLDLGDLAGNQLPLPAGAAAPGLLSLLRADDLAGKPLPAGSAKLDNCEFGGTADVTATLADPNTLTVDDRIVGIFVDCDDGYGYALSGTIDLTVAALEGDLPSGIFLVRFGALMTDVSITDGSNVVGVNGDFDLTLDSLDFPVISQTLGGWELILESGPEIAQFTGFDHYFEVDTGASPETVFVTVSGRLDSQLLGGYFDYETTVPVQAVGDEDPYTGEILITGAGGSTVRIVINSITSITLEVDTNGDGVVDNYYETNFAALNGHSGTVNTSTAPVIAREVIHAVTGFGSLAIAPGAQFMAAGPFGQVRLQAVSGDFGPVQVDCSAGGTASVSGTVAAAGTFSQDDQLDATLTNCARGGEILNGGLGFSVASYAELAGDAYLVSGTATETAFERAAGGNSYRGYGDIETSYDYRYTSTGFTYMNSSSPSFTLDYGDMDHYLTGPTVSAEVTLGTPPVSISRSSTGVVTIMSLVGDFAYESVTPDMFYFDDDPATGPYSGEILVRAPDGSTLGIVAIDELNVRLDVDYEGDGVVDTQMEKTWAVLQ